MKNKMMKILGVALTLAVLVGLLLPAMPVSAGTMTWTSDGFPGILTNATENEVIAFAPDGKVVFAYDNETGLVKSTNAGESWLPGDKADEDNILTGENVYAIAVSPRYADDGILVAVSEDTFFYSDDGGKTFEADWEEFPTLLGPITGLSISYNYDDKLAILVCSEGSDIVMYIGKAWEYIDSEDWVGEVYGVAFAPDYADSDTLMALVEDYDGTDRTDFFTTRIDSNKTLVDENYTWKQAITFKAPGVDFNMDADYRAQMAFPSDYDSSSNAIVFVGIWGWVADSGDEDYSLEAYRADLKSETGVATNLRLDKKFNAEHVAAGDVWTTSMDYKGTASSGTLAVAVADEYDGATDSWILTSTNADTAEDGATWAKAKKAPTGWLYQIAFSPVNDNLYVGSSNVNGDFGSVLLSVPIM